MLSSVGGAPTSAASGISIEGKEKDLRRLVVERLDSASDSSRGGAFGDMLRSQREFHNPQLFQDVVAHYDIGPVYGSRLPLSLFDPTGGYEKFEYVDRILKSAANAVAASQQQYQQQSL